jgi:hypothetical protein
MYCYYCGQDNSRDEWESAALAYDAKHGRSGEDLRCPNSVCEEPFSSSYDDWPDDNQDPEPEPSPLDSFVQELFQPGDEEPWPMSWPHEKNAEDR